ncbi:MAG: glucosaminyltransferase [Candidatus Methanoperedens nitroreducens]|uniref:Glucosaminyltransferase n=1 Tax=Candidatus Methanoperedens nitratireducens TaxID=1392998 RepID=A0A0N8KQ33_9EURY|nr:glycosyltransferase [Candidatus Methanoperedens sp. BLZ2]KAB2947789.1 MAG: glycosyltransferase family 2 protein [Candidatus Methanoperedens sp.]KPQ41018.1 MAG: glucosaminyltransferase [Candidatus Methanoperedens sp. BLZ1]
MKVSIIICTKDRPLDLMICLKSIFAQSVKPGEIIIIDSSNSEEKINHLKEFIRENKIIKHYAVKAGLTRARNIGIEKSIGEIIIFLDDDVILDDDYVNHILKIFDAYENVGLVTGNMIQADMATRTFSKLINNSFIKEIRNVFFFLFFLHRYGNGYFLPSGLPRYIACEKKIKMIECVQGANMAFRRNVLDEFHFDEHFKGYSFMEDCDISYRVSRKYKVIFTPFAELIHKISPVSRDSERYRAEMLLENHFYLFQKNFPQTLLKRFAFWISIIGLFLMATLRLSSNEFRGYFCACIEIFKKKRKNKHKIICHVETMVVEGEKV